MQELNLRWALVGFVALLLATASAEDSLEGTTRIVGGQIITIEKAPYIVQLNDPFQGVFCAGTLVTSTHVVTAAHCFDEFDYKKVTVVGGVSKREEVGEKRKIISVTISPAYDSDTAHSDIAVVKLNAPLSGENMQTIPLCSRSLKTGDRFQVSGWGKTKELTLYGSDELRTVTLSVISPEDCAKKYANSDVQPTESAFCTYTKDKDACTYDSGGPGIYGGELCGVVSWGLGCALKSSPGVFTKVSAMREFIEAAIRK